jgi:hypothetical protein
LTQPIAAVAAGAAGAAATAANDSQRSGATAGAAAAFAGTVRSGTAWNWSHDTGAVAAPHAVETAIASASHFGSGHPSSARRSRGTSVKIETTAANESWKPGSRPT